MCSSNRFIIDGHNVLYALRTHFAACLVDGHPGTAAREALVESLTHAFSKCGQIVRIYFDGAVPNRERRSAQVEVIYPGGEGDQRADEAILSDLAGYAAESRRPVATVVTRDIKLARRARKRGATVIDPEAFLHSWMEKTDDSA